MNIFNGFYSVLIILVALVSLFRGFKMGISRQVAQCMGFAFGAVAAQVLTPKFTPDFLWAVQFSQAPEFNEFTVNLVCAVVIYAAVFFFFSLFSIIFNKAFSIFEVGIINQMFGALFALVKNLLWVSIVLNLLLCISTKSGLLYYEKSNDGNLVGSVMAITPAILGCYGAEDFALFHQLKEAKYISCNFNSNKNVILTCHSAILT